MEYLHYCGIIWIVLEEYSRAAEALRFVIRLEIKDSNLKTDAQKKYMLVKLLLGESVPEKDQAPEYQHLIQKLVKN